MWTQKKTKKTNKVLEILRALNGRIITSACQDRKQISLCAFSSKLRVPSSMCVLAGNGWVSIREHFQNPYEPVQLITMCLSARLLEKQTSWTHVLKSNCRSQSARHKAALLRSGPLWRSRDPQTSRVELPRAGTDKHMSTIDSYIDAFSGFVALCSTVAFSFSSCICLSAGRSHRQIQG